MAAKVCTFEERCVKMQNGGCKVNSMEDCDPASRGMFFGRCSLCGSEGPVRMVNQYSQVCDDNQACRQFIDARTNMVRHPMMIPATC